MLVALIAAAVVVGLLAALLVAGLPVLDRRCALLAERKAAEYLSAPFGHPATVRLHHRPFLPQALRGVYRDVEVLGALRIGDINGATLDAHLTNARLPLRELLGRCTRELPCEHVAGRLVLPYAELAPLARIPGLVLAFEGERLVASLSVSPAVLPVSVPGIGQLTRISGEAVLTLAEGGRVYLAVRGLSVAGMALPGLVLSQLLPTLNVPIPLPPLPYGLRLDELRPTAAGLVVDGSADAVVFRPAGVTDAAPRPTPFG